GLRPEIVGCRRVPCRHMNSIRYMTNGHFVRWPVFEEWFKKMSADFSMQATHTIHRPTPTDGQIGHVETLRRIVRILSAQSQQVVDGNSEFLLSITAEVLLDERRSETIEAGGHRR